MKTKLLFFALICYKTLHASSIPTPPPECLILDFKTIREAVDNNDKQIFLVTPALEQNRSRIKTVLSAHKKGKITLTNSQLDNINDQKLCNDYQRIYFAMALHLHRDIYNEYQLSKKINP